MITPTTVSIQRLREVVSYCPETGVFIWLISHGNRKAGHRAGCVNKRGYRRFNVDGVSVAAHRAAWVYMTGKWPEQHIDHRDGEGDHNEWSNLRLATREQNQANARIAKTNKTGFKGVSMVRGRFHAQIWHLGRSEHIGLFDTGAEAHAAYLRRAMEIRDPQFVRAA